MAEGLHRSDLAVARDRDLASREDTFVNVARRAIHQGLHLVGVEANFTGAIGKKVLRGHRVVLLRNR